MMRKTLASMALIMMLSALAAAENESQVDIYFFWGDGCPHCEQEKPFLHSLEEKYDFVKVYDFETWYNTENAKLITKAVNALGEDPSGVPTTIIGDLIFVGYLSEETTGAQIEERVLECSRGNCTTNAGDMISCCVHVFIEEDCGHCEEAKPFLRQMEEKYGVDFVWHQVDEEDEAQLIQELEENNVDIPGFPVVFIGDKSLIGTSNIEENLESELVSCSKRGYSCSQDISSLDYLIGGFTGSMPGHGDFTAQKNWVIDLPIFGSIDASEHSLLFIAIVIGTLDGFNPCAMWVLCFLLTMLVYTKSRKKMFIVGGIFLFISALAYFMFMTAWLNLFLYVGYLPTLRYIVGVGAIAAGMFNLKDFFFFGQGLSLSIPETKKKGIISQMRKIINAGSWTSIIAGTIVLAVTVNFIELMCTAGLPAIFTKILTLNELSTGSYYFYMGVYIFMYMIDDMIIFAIAVHTLSSKKIGEGEGRWLKLISGGLMLILGILLIFAPQLLMFG